MLAGNQMDLTHLTAERLVTVVVTLLMSLMGKILYDFWFKEKVGAALSWRSRVFARRRVKILEDKLLLFALAATDRHRALHFIIHYTSFGLAFYVLCLLAGLGFGISATVLVASPASSIVIRVVLIISCIAFFYLARRSYNSADGVFSKVVILAYAFMPDDIPAERQKLLQEKAALEKKHKLTEVCG